MKEPASKKEETLIEFLKGLRIVLNNASAYHKDHPYYIKSVEIFRKKIETLFGFLSPVKINIAPQSLFVDGKYLEKTMLYVDLAFMFHIRKIKSVEFRQGLGNTELINFLSSISMPLKEVLRKGGIQNILHKEESPHITVEELDYSELLRDEGEEAKDIWVYLFKAAVEKEELAKINAFAQNFDQIIGKFKAKDLFEDDELRQNIYNFLSYLKKTAGDKFCSCSRDLLKLFLRDPGIVQQEKLEKIRAFFQDLTNEDLIDVFIDSISKEDDFNHLSFSVFSRLFDQNRHKEIASALGGKIRSTESLKNNPRLRKKVKELFLVAEDSYILPLYRQALAWLAEERAVQIQYSFDQQLLQVNYCFLLLNLLAGEKNPQTVSLIAGRLLKDCEIMTKESNWEYLKALAGVLDQKAKEDLNLAGPLEKLQERLSTFLENKVFEEESLQQLEYFVNTLNKSSLGVEFYLDNIFKERKVNPCALKLLLKFFPGQMPLFYENLERTKTDIDFLVKIVKSLRGSESSLGLDILKRMFVFSNNIIRMEILETMQSLSAYDRQFLSPILKSDDPLFKRQVLMILAREASSRKIALAGLFSLSSPLGLKNKVLIENMNLLDALGADGLTEARGYLVALSKKRFFWNKNIREKATEILRKIDAR